VVSEAETVLATVSSVTVTRIVSQPVKSELTRWVDRTVGGAYQQAAARVGDYRRQDQLRAAQAAALPHPQRPSLP